MNSKLDSPRNGARNQQGRKGDSSWRKWGTRHRVRKGDRPALRWWCAHPCHYWHRRTDPSKMNLSYIKSLLLWGSVVRTLASTGTFGKTRKTKRVADVVTIN
eukprot:1187827-Prorocentrum_minimum.AAC.7